MRWPTFGPLPLGLHQCVYGSFSLEGRFRLLSMDLRLAMLGRLASPFRKTAKPAEATLSFLHLKI